MSESKNIITSKYADDGVKYYIDEEGNKLNNADAINGEKVPVKFYNYNKSLSAGKWYTIIKTVNGSKYSKIVIKNTDNLYPQTILFNIIFSNKISSSGLNADGLISNTSDNTYIDKIRFCAKKNASNSPNIVQFHLSNNSNIEIYGETDINNPLELIEFEENTSVPSDEYDLLEIDLVNLSGFRLIEGKLYKYKGGQILTPNENPIYVESLSNKKYVDYNDNLIKTDLIQHYLRNDSDQTIDGAFTINDTLYVDKIEARTTDITVYSDLNTKNIKVDKNIQVLPTGKLTVDSITTNTNTDLNITTSGTNSKIRLNKDVVIAGDLFIQGDTTTIDTSTLIVEDKNIELGNVKDNDGNLIADNDSADGGGITLKAGSDGDKTIIWKLSDQKWHLSPGLTVDGETHFTGDLIIDAGHTAQIDNIKISANKVESTSGTTDLTIKSYGASVKVDDDLNVTGEIFSNNKNIILNNNYSSTNLADGGGIILKDVSNRSITWDSSTSKWTISNGLNVDGEITTSVGMHISHIIWDKSENLNLKSDTNNTEWSIDMRPNSGVTGNYFQIWSDASGIGTCLKVEHDNGNVTIPHKLYLTEASDVSTSGDGPLVIGNPSGIKLSIDSNEIMAKNNNSTSTLYLQSEGGILEVGNQTDVTSNFHGTLSIDYIKLDNKTISVTESNGNLTLQGNGIGTINLSSNTNITESNNLTVGGDVIINGGDLSINSNNGGINFSDDSKYWLKTATNWGLYWNTGDNRFEFKGSGNTNAWIDLDNGSARFNNNVSVGYGLTITTGIINHTATDSYDKIRVWNSSSYTIGMKSSQSFGYLNDYAMTFTMNDDADRGWLWRDTSDSESDGAMSLTTDGRLTVKGISLFKDNMTISTGKSLKVDNVTIASNSIKNNSTNALIIKNENTGGVTIDDNLIVSKNLTVNGTTTTIDTANLSVTDKNIEIGVSSSASNTTADGGGITLKAGSDGDKKIYWSSADNAWHFTPNAVISNVTGTTSNADKLDNHDANYFLHSLTAGDGITVTSNVNPDASTGSSYKIEHSNTSDQNDVSNTGSTVIQSVTLDSFGHVKTLSSKNLTDTLLPLSGGTMAGDIAFNTTGHGLTWNMNSDGSSIKFYNTSDSDTNSRLEFNIRDNGNEFFLFTNTDGSGTHNLLKMLPNAGKTGITYRGYTVWTAENDGSGSGLDADKLDGYHASSFINTSLGAGNYIVHDTRNNNTPTSLGSSTVKFEFKYNSTDGLYNGGTYHGVMTFQPWGDSSGGHTHQMAFTDYGNVYIRDASVGGSWGSWSRLMKDGDSVSGSNINGGTIDGGTF